MSGPRRLGLPAAVDFALVKWQMSDVFVVQRQAPMAAMDLRPLRYSYFCFGVGVGGCLMTLR